ncbi:hypothetical protein PUNSTDRAFT_44596 [Punctularia strigosozonata HHB-11173 SS5]|uniref:uncharacterized protein n=1 Tax=Punctularia strigosozonata (strain HHB-11173) TaxID=741275 RepID=UPI0004417089|nr:uncharacterized protein PUNSTDRAFT_44596 [Punctularia strigosozonata HHB-11173 SS5]EIN09180.1 hypothetical protein PUNSTDRAFT_44596 [Punctularia strigosozonata HHB-11173 SS5]
MADADTLMNFDDDPIGEFLKSPVSNDLTAALGGTPFDNASSNPTHASGGTDNGPALDIIDGNYPPAPVSETSSVAIINEDPESLDPSFSPVDDFLALGFFIFMKKSARQFILRSPTGDGGFTLDTIAHTTLNRFLSFDEKIRSHAVPASAELPDGYYDFATKFNNLVPKTKACFSTYIPGDASGTRYYIHGPSPRAIFFTPEIRAAFSQRRRDQLRPGRARPHAQSHSGTPDSSARTARKNRPMRNGYVGIDRRGRNAPPMSDAQLRERILLEAVRESMNERAGSRF